MTGHSTGSEASVGALREGPLWISCNQARAACVLSICAVIEMVQNDPTENCSEVRADALSCQGQSHDETRWRQGHTFMSPLSLSLAEGIPCPPQAILKLDNNFPHTAMSPAMSSGGAASCADTSRAGCDVRSGGGEWSWGCCLIQPGWSRDNGNIIPHSAVSGKSLPQVKDLPPVVKPCSICGISYIRLVATKGSTYCECSEKSTRLPAACTVLRFIASVSTRFKVKYGPHPCCGILYCKGNSCRNIQYPNLYNPSIY